LSWDDRAVVSPHIGDMDSPRSLAVFEQVVGDLQELYGIRAERIICDAHPGYATTRWARRQNRLPVSTVWHHRAHAAALAAETGLPGPWLIFTWDGVGLGEDRSLWGGEALLGECGDWKRVCSLRPFRPPGGDRAGREPWRSAAALIWETGRQWRGTGGDIDTAHRAWRSDLNCPRTSAAGRLFDAAAALICGVHRGSYEAQGPMQLEALARRAGSPLPLPLLEDGAGVLRSDWEPLLDVLCDDHRDTCVRAEDFHSSMARVIADQAVAIRSRHEVRQIGLAGGVFQNRLLTEQALTMLEAAGFDVCLNRQLPANDAGLSFGQAAEWAARCEREAH
jgi:hydrogenase maturation protein HypF